MSDLTIRALQSSDIPAVVAWIDRSPLWQRYGYVGEKARAALGAGLQRADYMLVANRGASEGGHVCGLAWVRPQGVFGRSPYLRMLAVDERQTGAGLGAALLDEMEQVVADYASEMFLLVADFNEAAQRFYRRQGYAQVGAIPGYVLPDVTELLYWKHF